MLDNMAVNRSEMSAISLYTYNQLITDEHKEIAEIFHKISIVEMHHLYIFGTLARQLGADPRLWTSRHNRAVYWSPGFNQYPKALPQLIEHSLQEEQFAVEKYTKQINVIKDEVIIHNLKRIAYGGLTLSGVKRGGVRQLTQREVSALKALGASK